MSSIRSVVRAGAVAALWMTASTFAVAAEAGHCIDASAPRKAVEDRKGKWIELTQEQWEFLRGVYAMNPATPPGLPYGDKAVLARVDNDSGGLIFFIDGDRACTPMPAPAALLTMLDDVAMLKIKHEGSGL